MSRSSCPLGHPQDPENGGSPCGEECFGPGREANRLPLVESIANDTENVLRHLGLDSKSPGLKETPLRFARAMIEYTEGYRMDLKSILKSTFPGDGYGTYDEMIVQRDIPFYSLCEHHLAPFAGVAHIGYIPKKGGRIIGLSKLARLTDYFSQRLQVQERLTVQISDALFNYLKPRGVGVVIEARHLCISMRGIRKPNTVTVTSSLRGAFRKPAARQEFLATLSLRRAASGE